MSAATVVKFEGTASIIMLYHRQQVFPMAEKQFLNEDHHKVQDSEVKPCHMPRYSPITTKKQFFLKNISYIFLKYLLKSLNYFKLYFKKTQTSVD